MADLEAGSLVNSARPPRSRGFFLYLCRLLNLATGVCSLLCLVAHAMAFFSDDSDDSSERPSRLKDQGDIQLQILRVFGIMFAGMASLVETEWEGCTRHLRLFEAWSIRGVFHIFLATFTLHIATATGSSEFDLSVNLYSLVAGYSMLGCGLLYLFGGLLCFGKIRRALRRKVGERLVEKERIERDLHALQSKQHELQGRLATYSDD